MTTKITFEQQLEKLKNEYTNQLPQKLADINSGWNDFIIKSSDEKQKLLETLHRNVHSLIGTSGTFGFTELSKSARTLETSLKPILDNNENTLELTKEFATHISTAIDHLFSLLKAIQDLNKNGAEEKSTLILGERLSNYGKQEISTAAGNEPLIYYVDSESTGVNLLTQQLSSYGFKTSHFRTLQGFQNALEQVQPSLVLFDLGMPDMDVDNIFMHAKNISALGIKVIFLSGKDNIQSRLAGVRAGAHAYLIKPADVPSLVEIIRNAFHMNINKPPHILIVDDQDSVAQFYSSVLTQAGMKTTVETNPFNTLKIMQANVPDLLLLDLNMPDMSGNELGAIIRQYEQYQSIPMLFLSAEFNIERKINLLEIGSDDLLLKGMPPEELVRQVKSRLARAKILTAMMYQDSLTGLLNHAQIQLAAERVFNKCKRHHTTLCIIMIDIDHFKKVNDTYGHLTGDRVIKALAYLLEKRFRLTDYVGRFGGEEFMLVLPDINLKDASNLINNLRKTFAATEFKEGDINFTVSFSAGVAENIGMNNFIEQIKCADGALYKAKARGRNVVCANLTNDAG